MGSCMKYIMFLFNLFFAMTGLFILTIGAIIQISLHHYSTLVDQSLSIAPILMIVVGGIVFVIAFCGCCGAVQKNRCMIMTYCIFLIIIFVIEIGIGVAGYAKHGQLEEILEKGFQSTMDTYETSMDSKHVWNLIQAELQCCGIHGPGDWKPIFRNETLPRDCCTAFPLAATSCTVQYSSQDGCLPNLLSILQTNTLTLAAVGVGIAIVQLFALCFACCLR